MKRTLVDIIMRQIVFVISVNQLCYYCDVFFSSKLVTPRSCLINLGILAFENLFLIGHLTWDTFLKDIGHTKWFFLPIKCWIEIYWFFSLYRIIKIVGFLLENKSNFKITLKMKCVVIYHGNYNSNHSYCWQMLR